MPDERAVPGHLALIPDGNRRWARARGLGAAEGHRSGIDAVGTIAEHAFARGVEVVSFWWGSPANLTRRAPDEVAGIVGALDRWLREEAPGLCARADASFEAIGRWRALCPSLGPAIEALPRAGRRTLVLLMAYDGRDELRAAADVADGAGLEAALWTGHLPPVDLLVRTGGGAHFSAGFLLWKLAEAQLAFPEALWPAFTPGDLDRELDRYARTERRFGR
jgi:undecaprenyl diphosphate synthase